MHHGGRDGVPSPPRLARPAREAAFPRSRVPRASRGCRGETSARPVDARRPSRRARRPPPRRRPSVRVRLPVLRGAPRRSQSVVSVRGRRGRGVRARVSRDGRERGCVPAPRRGERGARRARGVAVGVGRAAWVQAYRHVLAGAAGRRHVPRLLQRVGGDVRRRRSGTAERHHRRACGRRWVVGRRPVWRFGRRLRQARAPVRGQLPPHGIRPAREAPTGRLLAGAVARGRARVQGTSSRRRLFAATRTGTTRGDAFRRETAPAPAEEATRPEGRRRTRGRGRRRSIDRGVPVASRRGPMDA